MSNVINNFGTRYLAKGVEISNKSHETQLNNNDCIIGNSGSGKTTSYVYGNIAGKYGSYIIADTKGNLAMKFGSMLRKAGYEVKVLDLVNTEKSVGYNPLDYIRRQKNGTYNQQDVQKLAELMSPVTMVNDPYWETGAMNVICSLLALTLETNSPKDQNLCTVSKYAAELGFTTGDEPDGDMIRLCRRFVKAHQKDPDSFAWKKFLRYRDIEKSEKTWACITNFVHKAMSLYDINSIIKMFLNPDKIDLAKPGREKCAYFVNISDSDRTMDTIANIFYSQLFQTLIADADHNKDGKLDVPVRIILDDFATNVYIPYFDKLISVIRSREISVSIILQSITQLNTLYGDNRARTIINNCDHLLYMGGHDFESAKYISDMANVPLDKVIDMPLDKQYILIRGQKAQYVERLAPDAMTFDDEDGETVEPASQATETEDKKVVLENVPKKLVTLTGTVDKRYYEFNFAYEVKKDSVIFATIRLPQESVIVNDRKCTLTLGTPDTVYSGHLSGENGITSLTADAISQTYHTNRGRYIAFMKKRPPRVMPQRKN